jgi:hypothetical protein
MTGGPKYGDLDAALVGKLCSGLKVWLHLLSHILGSTVSHRAFVWKGRSYVQILDRMTCHEHEELAIDQ